MLFGEVSSSPCGGDARSDSVIVEMTEWRRQGKPPNADEYREAAARVDRGERREFTRYEATLDVRLSRLASWKSPDPQTEPTRTEVIARGGALVRSRMALDQGESVVFELGDYRTRAEVVYLNPGRDGEERFLRVGLRFLDEPLPASAIPEGAEEI